ncbi:MAG TPA: iron ABC transporter substrate-binding protein [Acidimicrobiales bacterium]|nr:iron ABC transporter substrate-binding protein [Acidimicrobiales bacterium]
MPKTLIRILLLATVAAATLTGCGGDGGGDGDKAKLVVYAGRNENLVRPLLDRFTKETGIDLSVRYNDTAELLPTIIEEGSNARADVFLSQDAGALGELAGKNLLRKLPDDIVDQVEPRFRDDAGRWVGVTGRARVIAYNTERVTPADLPRSVLEVVDPKWKGKVGFPPTNASFVSFVSSLREMVGDDRTRSFLEGLKANDAKFYDNNVVTIDAVASGEIELGLVNHYYLYNEFKERPKAPVANYYPGQDAAGEGTFVNVSGVGVLANTDQVAAAERFVRFLLDEKSQHYFRDETAEYPMRKGIDPIAELPPLGDLKTIDVPLAALGRDLEGTVKMLKDVGLT